MSFLEALNEFLAGKNPGRVIFDVVSQLLDEFIFYKKSNNRNISDIRFDELRTITYERLIKDGFKSVAKFAVDEESAKNSIRYLISQYYNSQYIKANPKIEQLNKDVKYLLNQFSEFFPQIGSRKLTEHKIITITSENKDIELLKDYEFAKNEPRKTRLKKVAFTIFEILSYKKSLSYSDLINNLKEKLNMDEFLWVELTPEAVLGSEQERSVESVNHDKNSKEPENFEGDINFIDKLENQDFEDSIINCGENEIDRGINLFLKLCTERQRIVFGIYILLKNATDQKKKGYYKNQFAELSNLLDIKRQTLYNERNKSIDNLAFVFRKLDLTEKEKQLFMRKLISGFEDYFKGS